MSHIDFLAFEHAESEFDLNSELARIITSFSSSIRLERLKIKQNNAVHNTKNTLIQAHKLRITLRSITFTAFVSWPNKIDH